MIELELLHNVGVMVVAATLCALILRMVKVPGVVAYIIAGLILGPWTGILEQSDTIYLISKFGIILLLFLVGLKLSIQKIKDIGKTAFIVGGLQMTLTALGGYAIAQMFGIPIVQAVCIGIAIIFSSTVIVIKLLENRGDLDTKYGQICVGVLLVQDLVVVIVLTLVAGLGGQEALSLGDVGIGLAKAVIGLVILGSVVFMATKYILPPVLGWMSPNPSGLFIWSLFWCFLIVMASNALNLSPEIGAFLAGIAIAQLPYHVELQRRVHPLMNFLIALFFVSLGLEMQLGDAFSMWPMALALILFTMIAKPIIFFVLLPRLGHGEETSFRTGITLAQVSEFGLIFATFSMQAGLIDDGILSVITLVALSTFALSSFLVTYNGQIYDAIKRYRPLGIFGATQIDSQAKTDRLSNHIIVIGLNTMGRYIIDQLIEKDYKVVAIDTDRDRLANLPPGVIGIHGDALQKSVLHTASFSRARLLVSALYTEENNDLLAHRCKLAGIPCAIHAFDDSIRTDLQDLDTNYIMPSVEKGTQAMITELKKRLALSHD